MQRVISLFSDPKRYEAEPLIGLPQEQREPAYFRHLMEYLHQRRAEQQQVEEVVEEECPEALTCS